MGRKKVEETKHEWSYCSVGAMLAPTGFEVGGAHDWKQPWKRAV